jgi:hypothetical protein
MCEAKLSFPFWLLIARGESPWNPVALTPGYAAAFSSHARAGEFLSASANPAWEVRLIVRSTLASLSDEFARRGVRGVALDPDPTGGGTRIGFDLPAEEAIGG